MYKLIFDTKAIESLEKLPKNISKRIFKKIQETKKEPHRFFIRLTKRKDYKLRIGDYRVIADLNDKEKAIEVTLIGHRNKIYKNL